MSDYMDTAFGTPPWNNPEAEELENQINDLTRDVWEDMKAWEVLEDAVRDFVSEYTNDYEIQLAIRERILPCISKLYD